MLELVDLQLTFTNNMNNIIIIMQRSNSGSLLNLVKLCNKSYGHRIFSKIISGLQIMPVIDDTQVGWRFSIMASILRVNTLTDASSNNSIATSFISMVVLKHWFTINGWNCILFYSFNVASLTDDATGKFSANLTSAMNNFNYALAKTLAVDDKMVVVTQEIMVFIVTKVHYLKQHQLHQFAVFEWINGFCRCRL